MAFFGSSRDDLLLDVTQSTSSGDDDERFERWLADVSIGDFERILDSLLTDHDLRWEPTPAFEQAG